MAKTNQQSKRFSQWIPAIIGLIIGLFFLMQTGHSQQTTEIFKQTTLLAAVHIEPANSFPGHHKGKIQPGTSVKLSVVVENKGPYASKGGELYVRYAFAKPLDQENKSLIFETEKENLPVIEPGQQVTIEFKTPHLLPAVFDFVREDWLLREYQAIAKIDQKEKLLGTLALTFSAYYERLLSQNQTR